MFRPKFKEHYDVIAEASDRYQVRSSEVLSVLTGATVRTLFDKLLPLLDGEHTLDEIASRLSDVASPEVIGAVIDRLKAAKFVEDAAVYSESSLTPEELAHYRRQMIFLDIALDQGTPLDYHKSLSASRLLIIGDGTLATGVAAQAARTGLGHIFAPNLKDNSAINQLNPFIRFAAMGVALDDQERIQAAIEQEKPSLLLAAFDRPEPAMLRWANTQSLNLNIPLLISLINGIEGIVGPFVVPGRTPCLMCQHLRVVRNLDFYQEYVAWENWAMTDGRERRTQTGALAPFTDMVASMAAIEVFKFASGFHEPETYGKFITVDALTLEVIPHQVLRLPRCPDCGKARSKPITSPWQGV